MSEIIEKETLKQALKPPTMWNVILYNDDFTTMEFVIECLMIVFKKNREMAIAIMLQVHTHGKGIAGNYSKDIALTKKAQATEFAKTMQHPFRVEAVPMD